MLLDVAENESDLLAPPSNHLEKLNERPMAIDVSFLIWKCLRSEPSRLPLNFENLMNNSIPIPEIGEILKEEFIEPYTITLYKLVKAIQVPPSRILEILHGQRRVSVETGLRLARFFGTTEKF